MSTLFSRRCEYALQAVLFVADRDNKAMISLKELTGALGIPYHFLAKILQDLSHKGILVSHKGPQGGFALGRPAGEITLFEIVDAIDGASFTTDCVLGFKDCSVNNPCALHREWDLLREGVFSMLSRRSVGELARQMRKPGFSAVGGDKPHSISD